MLRLPDKSIIVLILFVTFWILLGSNVVSTVGHTGELGDKVKIINTDYKISQWEEDSVSLVVIAIVRNDNEKDVRVTLRIEVINSKNKVIKSVDLKNKLAAKSSETKLTGDVNLPRDEVSWPSKVTKPLKVRGKILEVKEDT